MTEDYKKGILDYISGNVNVESQKANEFRDNEGYTNNLLTKLTELGITPSKLIKTLFNEYTSNFIIYDQYTLNSKTYSYIAILSQNGEVLDILTTYESKTLIEKILYLDIDENGNIYGIDFPYDANKYRIIQLNNIAIPIGNNYVCRLRASYYINYADFSLPAQLDNKPIKKAPGQAKYFIYGQNTTQNKTELITFSNVVGVPLEWNTYLGRSISTDNVVETDYAIDVSGEEPKADIYFQLDADMNEVYHDYFNGESLVAQSDIVFPEIINTFILQDATTLYGSSRVNGVHVYKSVNGEISELFNFSITGSVPLTYLQIINGMLFFKTETFVGKNVRCGVYYDNQLIISDTYSYPGELIDALATNVQKTFSLYTFNIICNNQIYHPTIVIYDNNYSGESYSNYDTTLPLHSEIYSNGYIKFARNLYNRQIYQNQCISTANIPYNFINDITLSPSNLVSSTMTNLVSGNNEIIKNKYENLFINFMNKINVLDEDTGTLYSDTASYVNQNINIGTESNYNDTFVGKVRINYSSPRIQTLNWVWDTDHYETSFVLDTSEIPNSIDFLSNDESTIYLTKYFSNLEENKYYTISQKLRIE